MKRKRGNKKSKTKTKSKKLKQTPLNDTSPDAATGADVEDDDDNGDGDDQDTDLDDNNDNAESSKQSLPESEAPPPSTATDRVVDESEKIESETGAGKIEKIETDKIESDKVEKSLDEIPVRLVQKPVAVYGRVKLKLKNNANANANANVNAKAAIEPSSSSANVNSLDVAKQSDVNRSGEAISVVEEKQEVIIIDEKMEEIGIGSGSGSAGASLLPEVEKAGIKAVVAEELPKKVGSIKIKASKGVSSSDAGNNNTSSGASVDERSPSEVKAGNEGVRYDKEELDAALEVIKKVMKMDAAEPFNVPVNPVEIPDYFDVIDTPMDFGTIRSNLESGSKYMNSEDVYRDVQYIWDNCSKYNNKGDYILELMKRLKKGFSKYWSSAGLYSGDPRKSNEGLDAEDGTPSQEKKPKKGKGFKSHKDGCLCAICIMRRKRLEREAREKREAREARGQVVRAQSTTNTNLAGESKQEESTPAEIPPGDDTSSYMETSPDINVEGIGEGEDIEDDVRTEKTDTPQTDGAQKEEVQMEHHDEGDRSGEISEKSQRGSIVEDESNPTSESKLEEASGGKTRTDAHKQFPLNQDGLNLLYQQKKLELLELEKKRQKAKLLEKFRGLEHPTLLELSGTLFSTDPPGFWSGPNSLVRRQHKSSHVTDIHKAVASFMKSSSKMTLRKRV